MIQCDALTQFIIYFVVIEEVYRALCNKTVYYIT